MSPILDLSDADTSGFEPIDSGPVVAVLFKHEWKETKGGPNAKLPAGTPRMNFQFKALGRPGDDKLGEGNDIYNRRFFYGLSVPPAKGTDGKAYPKDKAATMKGMIVRFFQAFGLAEDQVVSPEFDVDGTIADLISGDDGVKVILTVAKKQKYNGAPGEMDNEVKGVKPYVEGAGAGAGKLL